MSWRPMDIAIYCGRGALVTDVEGDRAELWMAGFQRFVAPLTQLQPPPAGPPVRLEEARAERESFVRQRGLS